MFKLHNKKVLNIIFFIDSLLAILSSFCTYKFYDQEKKLNAVFTLEFDMLEKRI